ncbi:MAG: ornithine carbamoyltransferase [Firmicutes bacterium]|nr:ornithine carbamoyltransferase [Bacillota bacterium]
MFEGPVAELKGRDFLSLADYSRAELEALLDLAQTIKAMPRDSQREILKGKTLGMIFQKASTRTRVSFEVGIYQLGGYGLFLSGQDLQLRRGETIGDTAQVLSRYLDGIMIRTFGHDEVEELARYASVPVINGLTDLLHPCQALGDYFTLRELRGDLAGRRLAYVGDGNNMAHSLLLGGAILGVSVVVISPEAYLPQETIVQQAKVLAEESGSNIEVTSDLAAVEGADVLYTDVWASMGQEREQAQRVAAFRGYQVNQDLLGKAKKDAVVMHCLPAHRGEEISAEVMDGPQSVIFQQAENRLHIQKAIMAALMR